MLFRSINNMAQVFEDPQVKHRKMRVEVPHPQSGTVPMVASPIRLSDTPIEYFMAPPTLGQHTIEVLQNHLAIDAEELERLATLGVI